MDIHDWLKLGSLGPQAFTFSAGVWWAWRHRNLMILNNETWSLYRLSYNIQSMVEDFMSCFTHSSVDAPIDMFVKWNNNNYRCTIFNVDGSCLGSPVRTDFGGLIKNNSGYYLSGYSGFIHGSSDIMLAELYAIYRGLILAKDMAIGGELVCYSDSLHCINLIKGSISKFHVHAELIQDIKELLSHNNVTLCHTLRERNQCADFLAKLGASSDAHLVIHSSPPTDMFDLLRSDTTETVFIRE